MAEFERLRMALLELEKPSEFFEKLRKNGEIGELYPEVKALIGVPQNLNYHREGDVWTHTMMVLDEAAKRRDLAENRLGFMLAALCHDFGKALCTEEVDGVVHAYGHEAAGIAPAAEFLRRLGVDGELTAYVLNMVELHMEPNIMAGARSRLKKTNRLFDRAVCPFDLIQLAICDGLGKIPQNDDPEEFLTERYEKFREIMAQPYVTADDLRAAGVGEDELPEVLGYAHKLRLAGCSKEDQLRQSLAFARKNKKKFPENS